MQKKQKKNIKKILKYLQKKRFNFRRKCKKKQNNLMKN
jgi:hypothetical protein